jgi:hypothetical protein
MAANAICERFRRLSSSLQRMNQWGSGSFMNEKPASRISLRHQIARFPIV